MSDRKKFLVSHAPFWHNGARISERSYHTMLATLPAVLFGLGSYGMPALGVLALSVSSAIGWEMAMNRLQKLPETVGDGNAALLGLLFGMLMPATTPWWAVITGTFMTVVIGKQIFGGIGGNPFNPVVLAVAILGVSWGGLMDFDTALVDYPKEFNMAYPLAALKSFGTHAVADFRAADLLVGRQSGGIGATFGIGLILGGGYLILRGFIRWEIALSFVAGLVLTAAIFHASAPEKYAGPAFHLLTGYSLIGAFFLATEDASSPVNFIPMLLYGLGCGVMTMLIRNIGAYADGVILAILMMNIVNPLLDKIRPKAMGKVA